MGKAENVLKTTAGGALIGAIFLVSFIGIGIVIWGAVRGHSFGDALLEMVKFTAVLALVGGGLGGAVGFFLALNEK